jgi:4-hydroxybenzoate polyprenyltransferase
MKRYLALSRTTHAILDIALPGFCALLWLGHFPPWPMLAVALLTVFAGYTAVYALNDLVGVAGDKEKFIGGINAGYSVEASELRYPLARDALSCRDGWLWCASWFVIAGVGAYILNPTILVILSAAALLEVIYCKLFKITHLRVLVSGMVKSAGPLAAVFAVDPHPTLSLLLLIFAWVFFWEIGGQNIPADWNDTVEDLRVNGKTIPIHFGTQKAGLIVVVALIMTVVTSLFLPVVSPVVLGIPYMVASGVVGIILLVRPGYQLCRKHKEGRLAAQLFDNASYYPLAQLAIILIFVAIKG